MIFGRDEERLQLQGYVDSNKPEFIALYGRRRVGKTYLVNQLYDGKFAFSVTGIINGGKDEQLLAFIQALQRYGYVFNDNKPTNWLEAFFCLEELLSRSKKKSPQIIFIDELPCFDTKGAGFVRALDHFWNSWASRKATIKLIVCGSATSWMISNVIDNHGGLHNRITHEMHLREFTLAETEQYLQSVGFRNWNRQAIVQLYMVTGGVPYYLSLLDKTESLPQNIDRLFFTKDAVLKREFDRLYKSLYNDAQIYLSIIRLLSTKKEGMSREEISRLLNIPSSGYMSQVLENLVNCDMVRLYRTRGKRGLLKGGLYQISDFFSIFHLTFLDGKTTDEHFWTKSINTPKINSWQGLAFERVCMAHLPQLLNALNIGGIHTECYSWRSKNPDMKAQIDLMIERSDKMANICEMKYSDTPYIMNKEEEERLLRRTAIFKSEMRLRMGYVLTLITPHGIVPNTHSCCIDKVIGIDELFTKQV